MNNHTFHLTALLVLALSTAPLVAQAQDAPYDPSNNQTAAAPSFSQAQLDQLLAPIALYPDPLIGQVLMASTYPLEVVEASRWVQNPNNAALTGDQLTATLDQQPWDPSVKALVSVPQVLDMMNKNLQWTEQLGDAFLAQQVDVMNSVQGLRQRAQAAGALASTPQQVVSTQGSDIVIEQENPNVVYVPEYNPTVVYGSWPYPSYQPYYFYPPGYSWGAGFIGFGVGIVVANSVWGWDRWDWHHHRIDIDNARFSALNRGQPPMAPGVWQHNPNHRHGVPYHDAATRSHFQGTTPSEAQRGFRGYSSSPAATPARTSYTSHPQQTFHPTATTPAYTTRAGAPQTQHIQRAQTSQPEVRTVAPHYEAPTQHYSAPAPQQRPATPMFESFSHGPDVRAQSARGVQSRAATPAANNFHPANGGGAVHASGGNRESGTNNHR